MQILIVTRHHGLVEFLARYIGSGHEVVAHATADKVKGRDVWGVLPLHLAAECGRFTEVPLDLPQDLRGKELTCEQVERYCSKPVTYEIVRHIHDICSYCGADNGTEDQANRRQGFDCFECGSVRSDVNTLFFS